MHAVPSRPRGIAFGLAAALALGGAALAQNAPAVAEIGMEAPNRILFVGNSYLYYGDSLHNHVVRMARAAYPDETFTYKSATIGGAYLDHHDINSHLTPGKLGLDEPFDVVVLQGHSTAMTSDAKVTRFNVAAEAMDEAIRATGARTALYMTPAYSEAHSSYDPEMFGKIDEGYTAAGNALGALVIPVGLAFEIAYERRPEIELHKAFDGSHPTLLGTYLASATTYAALYGKSVVGNPYDYFGSIPAADAAFLQQVAEDAVAAYYGRGS
jgi:hypothetical protein